MTILTAPDSTATIEFLDEENVERYEQAGWTRVEDSKSKKPAAKPTSK